MNQPSLFLEAVLAKTVSDAGPNSRVLLYAEVADGVISADLLWHPPSEPKVLFRFASNQLKNLVYALWEHGAESIPAKSFAAIALVIENGAFTADLKYPNEFKKKEALSDRRPRVIAE